MKPISEWGKKLADDRKNESENKNVVNKIVWLLVWKHGIESNLTDTDYLNLKNNWTLDKDRSRISPTWGW